MLEFSKMLGDGFNHLKFNSPYLSYSKGSNPWNDKYSKQLSAPWIQCHGMHYFWVFH